MKLVLRLSLLILLSGIISANATEISRGPYLQKLNTSSVTLRFRTDLESKTFVRYGKSEKNLDQKQDNFLFTKEHIIEISRLEPNTEYFYELYTDSCKGAKKINPNPKKPYSFKTAPEAASTQKSYIWILGDPGVNSEKEFSKRIRNDQFKVRDGFLNYLSQNKIKKSDLIITLGDNVYSFGTDEEFQKGFFDPYQDILARTPLFTCFGNHDAGIRKDFVAFSARSYPKPRGTYYENFSLPGKKAYYSFDYGSAHFVVLDSFDSLWEERLDEIEGNEKIWTHKSQKSNPMLKWLDNDLKESKSIWKIVIFHHPPYSDEDDQSEKKELWKAWMNAYAVPIMEKHKVDLVLSGHVHNYQRTYPIISSMSKEFETEITSKEKSEIDEPAKYSYFFNRGENVVSLRLPLYEAKIQSDNQNDYTKGEGTIYTVVGSSGSAFKKIRKKDNPLFAEKFQEAGSLLLTTDPNELSVKFINSKSEVLDEFNIKTHSKS